MFLEIKVCLEFPNQLVNVPSEVVIVDFCVQQLPFGVYDKCSPQGKGCSLIVDPEHPCQLSPCIGTHGEFDICKVFLIPLPCQVDKLGIGADRYHLGSHLFEPVVLLCQSSKFGCSDKCKVRRIEKEESPLLVCHLGLKADLAEIPF